jgi:hypothetical protein
MLGSVTATSLEIMSSRSLMGVASIGSSVRCCFSPTIENAAPIDDVVTVISK